MRDRVLKASGIRNPTPRDFVKFSPFIGGPREVADGLEEWFTTGVCDGGFVIAATHVPGTYMEFVNHKDYTGATLRENLGIPIPHRSAT
jgi:alkanesulfonate monooxygenase SsuD/methylene tetrahydromethanopterin reductase-like flavin-dependent oxidoreductase (luciferase family)